MIVFEPPVSFMRRVAALVCTVSALCAPMTRPGAQAPPEVRQIVTFLFQPNRSAEAFVIFEEQLKPIYADVPALRFFRGYREAETPEPLDLVVVSSYLGMAGMDAANEALRRLSQSGRSAFTLYGTLSTITQTHHDQFVEIVGTLSDTVTAGGGLTVFEYTRAAPGGKARFESQLAARVRPFELAGHLYEWSESGRMLVSDGWDFLRIYGVRSLGDWHHYLQQMRTAPFHQELDSLVAARKTLILRRDARLSIR